jgi:hypothetical protein
MPAGRPDSAGAGAAAPEIAVVAGAVAMTPLEARAMLADTTAAVAVAAHSNVENSDAVMMAAIVRHVRTFCISAAPVVARAAKDAPLSDEKLLNLARGIAVVRGVDYIMLPTAPLAAPMPASAALRATGMAAEIAYEADDDAAPPPSVLSTTAARMTNLIMTSIGYAQLPSAASVAPSTIVVAT